MLTVIQLPIDYVHPSGVTMSQYWALFDLDEENDIENSKDVADYIEHAIYVEEYFRSMTNTLITLKQSFKVIL